MERYLFRVTHQKLQSCQARVQIEAQERQKQCSGFDNNRRGKSIERN